MKRINTNMLKFNRIALLLALLTLIFAVTGCFDILDELLDSDDRNYSPDQPITDDGNFDYDSFSIGITPRELNFEPIEHVFHTDSAHIYMIEINQSLSYYYDHETGEMHTIENFVAGKETAVFVRVTRDFLNQTELATLTIERNGDFVAELLPVKHLSGEGSETGLVLYQPKNTADVDHWAEGAYTFTFNSNGETAYRTVNLYATMPMKVLAVPILANYSGTVIGCEGEWKSGGTMLYATYPLAQAGLDYVLGPELDLSDKRYDLDTENGLYNVWEALANLQTPSKEYEIIIGFIREAADNGTLAGYTFGAPANIVVESDLDMFATVVHEVAHCYMVGDEYVGGHINNAVNPPPYGMEGTCIITYRDDVGREARIRSGYQEGLPGSGSVVYSTQRPYWVEGRRQFPDVTSFMGEGTGADWDSMWVTADIWNHLFRIFTGIAAVGGGAGTSYGSGSTGNGNSSSGEDDGSYYGQCTECYSFLTEPIFYIDCDDCWAWIQVTEYEYECETSGDSFTYDDSSIYIECVSCEILVTIEAAQKVGITGKAVANTESVYAIDITGFFDNNGDFTPTPWYTYETEASELTARRSGEYSIIFYDGNGIELSKAFFNAKSQAWGGRAGESLQTTRIPVSETVRFPENTAEIYIAKGAELLYSTDVSKTAPAVAFTGLTDYEQLSDIATLTWEASAEAGRSLHFELWYCPAEDEFYNIASNITGNSFEINLSSYPGTEEGYFYIFATDGVRTGEAASEWVKVPYKAPEFITELNEIPEIKITEEFFLDVDIYDLQDGWLWDDEVTWTLDGVEFLTGSALWVWPYELAPGTHTFTCTAVNSAGISATGDFTIRIIDDESDLPDDWSRDDLINALSNGFVLPLSRIDGPVTRGEYASLMSILYFTLMDEDEIENLPDYVDNVVNDCGQDDYYQFFMVTLGVMDAPGGRFEPNKPITERDAAIIMYNIIALADPDLVDIDVNEADIIEIFEDNEITDSSGANKYNANENITVRLALVRLSRLYNAIFE